MEINQNNIEFDERKMETQLVLTKTEIIAVTGYKKPSMQLQELHLRGFFRARINPVTGCVILERQSFEAVCNGVSKASPKVQMTSRKESA